MLEAPPFDFGLHARFPADGFISHAEFEARGERDTAALARQARIEAALATAEPVLVERATCAACLRPAVLISRTDAGRVVEAGLRVPDWPHEQVCDCEDRLSGRDRALLHAAASLAGLRRWSRLLLFGPPIPVHRRLRALAGETAAVADLAPGPAIAAADGCADVTIAADCLHRAPALRPVLAELRRVAAPGGCMLARMPFRERATHSTTRRSGIDGHRLAPGELHAIGWDILAACREAGWAQAEMLRCWSRELGYLGARNFLLRASA